jgi:LEA14-like dessication related protein
MPTPRPPARTPAAPPWRATRRALLLALPAPLLLGGCASLLGQEPLGVTLVGVEGLEGEGLELRLLVKLRVQNPGEAEIAWDGIALDLEVGGRTMARGVSAQAGRLPRFGEVVLAVPVSVSGLAVLREVMALVRNPGERTRVEFGVSGRLGGALGGRRFASRAEIDWPPGGRATTLPSPRQP